MNKLIIAAAFVALAACSDNKTETPAATATPTMAVTPTTAAAETGYLVGAGTYAVTYADGSTSTSVLSKDGTFVDTEGAKVTKGTWKNDHGKTCFAPDDGTAPTCYAVTTPDAAGVMTATDDKGQAAKVTKTG